MMLEYIGIIHSVLHSNVCRNLVTYLEFNLKLDS